MPDVVRPCALSKGGDGMSRLISFDHVCCPRDIMACHHRFCAAHTVEQRQAWHAITAFGQHTRSNDVGHGMPSSRLGSTHGLTTSGVACHHHLWAAKTVERRRAWHDITALGLYARSDDVRHGMTSPPLICTHDWMTSGVACHRHLWVAHTIE